MAKVKVVALTGFSSAFVGTREQDEEFDYDLDADPAALKAEGKVKAVKAVKEPKAEKPPE